MTRFLYVSEFGDVIPVEHTEETTLRTLQMLVQGYVQVVNANPDTLGFDADIWVNEDGLAEPTFLPNMLASHFAGQSLVGPAVIARYDDDGTTVGLSDDDLKLLSRSLMVESETWTPAMAVEMRQKYDAR